MKKMKKMRNVVAIVLALVLMLSPMSVFAEELPTEARYDLEKGGTQTFTIREEDGSIATITVEELPATARIADGNYRVVYDNTVWYASFSVSISNNQFYNEYDPYNYCLRGEIRYPALTRQSVTHVAYAFIYVLNGVNYVTGVNAKIVNKELVISRR